MLFCHFGIKIISSIEHYCIHSHKSYEKSKEKILDFLHI